MPEQEYPSRIALEAASRKEMTESVGSLYRLIDTKFNCLLEKLVELKTDFAAHVRPCQELIEVTGVVKGVVRAVEDHLDLHQQINGERRQAGFGLIATLVAGAILGGGGVLAGMLLK